MKFGTLALAVSLLASAAAAEAKGVAADPALAKSILMKSVAIQTVKGQGQVPVLAEYYASVLKQAGFADADIHITPMGETARI